MPWHYNVFKSDLFSIISDYSWYQSCFCRMHDF